jgi:multicomponent Na+:H+ antiporter subunit B
MTDKLRISLYLLCASTFGAVLLIAMAGLPEFGDYQGPYGDLVMRTVVGLRHAQQGVAAVTFDYRGFDTLGEEFILFAAVAGALLLTRPQQSEHCREPVDHASDRGSLPSAVPVTGCGGLMFPFTLLLGIYLVFHGHLTPGGGFQGGVLAATAFYFLYLSGEYRDLVDVLAGHLVSLAEVAGAAGFAILGAVPLLHGEPYLLNMLPLGQSGKLLSAGNLPVLNCAVGLEVAAAFLLLVSAFLKQVTTIRKGVRR